MSMFDSKPALLKQMLQDLKGRLERLVPAMVFEQRAAATTVPADCGDGNTGEVILQPWHLPFSPECSVKGRSKMIFVLRLYKEFCERPFDSISNPIQVSFMGLMPGGVLPDFSLKVTVGYTKCLALMLLLYSAINSNLSDEEIILVTPWLRALYGIRCTFRDHQTMKECRFSALAEKMSEASRPRPDCIQIARAFHATLADSGTSWEEGCKTIMAEFNERSGLETKRLSELEMNIIALFCTLDPETQSLIEYHWSNYSAKNSGLPYRTLGTELLRGGLKPRVASPLWTEILTPDNNKRHFYVARRVRYFLHRIADAQRLKKRVNLHTGANALRDPKDEECAYAMSCLFSHFLNGWRQVLTADQVDTLEAKFLRGYLDTELNEKYRVQAPDLCAGDFRFLQDFGVQGAVTISVSENEAALKLQKAELDMQLAKLAKEQKKFSTYMTAMKDFQSLGMATKAHQADRQKETQRKNVTSYQESRFPLRDLSEVSHVATFVESAVNKYQNENSLGGPVFKVYYMNTQGLGYDALVETTAAIKALSGHVAAEPARTCMLISAPTVGSFGNEYSEGDALETAGKILQILKDPDQRLIVKEITQCFDQSTIPAQSKRPACHKWYLAISDQCDTGLATHEPLSLFARTFIWKRQMVPCKGDRMIPMLPVKSYVDPKRDFSTAKGLEDLSKPSRRKQWLAGFHIPAAFLDGLFAGMTPPPDRTSLCVFWIKS